MVMVTSCTTGSKYLEYNPGSELNIFLMNNEQWKLNQTKELNENKSRTKDEQKTNGKIEQQQNKSNKNNKIIHNITGT